MCCVVLCCVVCCVGSGVLCCVVCCVGSGLCDHLIICSEDSYGVCVCAGKVNSDVTMI